MNTSKMYALLLTFALLISAVSALSVFMMAPAKAQTAGDWPMFHHDSANTRYNPDSTAPSELKLQWMYQTGGLVWSSPAIVGGKLYIGSDDRNIYCLDANTGDKVWAYATGGAVRSSPACVGGKVYAGSFDYNVYCLDAGSGSLVWKFPTNYWVFGSPNVVDGKVFIISNDNNLYCLDANTGAKIWNFTTRDKTTVKAVYWNQEPCVVNGRVYFGGLDNYMYCLNETTGAKLWDYQASFTIGFAGSAYGRFDESSPTYADGRIFIGNQNYQWYAFNATTGDVIWHLLYNQALQVAAPSDNIIQNTAAVAYGNLYLIWPNPHMAAVENPATGLIINMGMMGQLPRSSLAVADNKAYCANNDRYMYVWNAADMSRLESVSFPQIITGSPAISGGKIYFGCHDRVVYCYGQGQTQGLNGLFLDPNPRTVPLGAAVTVTGGMNTYHGSGPEGQTIILHYVRPDGTAVTQTSTTGVAAVFSNSYTPDVEGQWKVKATWDGNPWWLGAESYYQTFTVTAAVAKPTTTISASVSNATIVTGKSVTVSGTISPAVNDAIVTLKYTKPDGTTLTRTSVTGAGGAYSDTYIPDTEGSWSVTASWPGSDAYQGSTSSSASFTVSAAQVAPTGGAAIPVEVIYAIVAIIVIIIIIAIAYWYMRRPKK